MKVRSESPVRLGLKHMQDVYFLDLQYGIQFAVEPPRTWTLHDSELLLCIDHY